VEIKCEFGIGKFVFSRESVGDVVVDATDVLAVD
jgi:hypothetical protein